MDFNHLIPELKDWNDGNGIDIQSWIGFTGNFQEAIGYSVIFWPTFVEIEGCIVREGIPRDNVLLWLKHFKGDRERVEAMVNHLHIEALHYDGCKDRSPERLSYLGKLLEEIYDCKLKRDFPNKTINVLFEEPENKEDLHGYILTFYQSG
jgi:hypothetical protein